jgi:hypothetical protein
MLKTWSSATHPTPASARGWSCVFAADALPNDRKRAWPCPSCCPRTATQSRAGRLCSTSRPCRNCDGRRSGARQFLRRTNCSCGPRNYEPSPDELLKFQTTAQQVHEHLLRRWYQMAWVHRFNERIAFRKAPIFRPVDGAGVTTVLCPARRGHEARRTISRFCTCGGTGGAQSLRPVPPAPVKVPLSIFSRASSLSRPAQIHPSPRRGSRARRLPRRNRRHGWRPGHVRSSGAAAERS